MMVRPFVLELFPASPGIRTRRQSLKALWYRRGIWEFKVVSLRGTESTFPPLGSRLTSLAVVASLK